MQTDNIRYNKRSYKEVKKAFRDSFAKLSSLRTVLPKCPVLALTATANSLTEKKIVKSLGMTKFSLIRVSPNRLNIRLSVVKFAKLDPKLLSWIVEGLKKESGAYQKTIIYCQSVENVAKVFVYFKEELGDDVYDSSKREKSIDTLLLGMYHRKTLDKHKERVLADLSNPRGSCRIVVATTSLSMGVDIPDLRCLIHYGSPLDIGKASPEMKSYVKTSKQCLRKALYGKFVNHEIKLPSLEDNCCSYCHLNCQCKEGVDGCCVAKPFYKVEFEAAEPIEVRGISVEDKVLLTEVLLEYKEKVEKHSRKYVAFADIQFITRFSSKTIENVVEKAQYVCSMEYLLENTPIILQNHAAEVILIFQDIFEDVDNVELLKAKQAIENFNEERCLDELDMLNFEMNDQEDDENEEFFEDFEEIEFSDNDEEI
eukprot:gene4126-4682_t